MPLNGNRPEYEGKRTSIDRLGVVGHEENWTQQASPAEVFSVKEDAKSEKKQKKQISTEQSISIESCKIQIPISRAYSKHKCTQHEEQRDGRVTFQD